MIIIFVKKISLTHNFQSNHIAITSKQIHANSHKYLCEEMHLKVLSMNHLMFTPIFSVMSQNEHPKSHYIFMKSIYSLIRQ